MRRLVLAVVLAAVALTFVVASTALADDDNGGTFRTNLDGYAEVVGGPGASTGSVSSVASGRFTAKLRNGSLDYTLTYENMEGGTVSQAHIHFAEEHVGGGVIAFLCAGDKPPCPTPSGTVTGTITAANVVGPADQGIEAGSFSELIAAMRAGAAYVNVHSTPRWPEGEIRGQIRGGRGDDD
jgi:CHRD domain